jgi:hypothetical protein
MLACRLRVCPACGWRRERAVGTTVSAVGTAAEALLCLLSDGPAERPSQVLERWSEAEWQAMFDEAVRQGVAPLLYQRLSSAPPQLAPSPGVLQVLRHIYLHNRLRNRMIFDEASTVLVALREGGVVAVVLKGLYLAESVYGDPALRPMADIDLLVRETDLDAVRVSLSELGYHPVDDPTGRLYSRHHHLPPWTKSGAVPVEVHTALIPRGNPFAVDVEGLRERSCRSVVAGVEALVLCPEDAILHLCVHAAYNHAFQVSLLRYCDLASLIARDHQAIDWPRLAVIANADGRCRLVYCVLRLVDRLFAPGIPALAFAALRHAERDDQVVDFIRSCLLTRSVDLPAVYRELGRCRTFREKASLLACRLFPASEGGRVMDRAFVWPMKLLARHGRVTAEILLRSRRVAPTLRRERTIRIIDRWLEEVAEPAARAQWGE